MIGLLSEQFFKSPVNRQTSFKTNPPPKQRFFNLLAQYNREKISNSIEQNGPQLKNREFNIKKDFATVKPTIEKALKENPIKIPHTINGITIKSKDLKSILIEMNVNELELILPTDKKAIDKEYFHLAPKKSLGLRR